MVEKVHIIETCLNERVSNWPMLTLSARSGSSGKAKQTFHKILTYLIILGIFLKSTRIVSLNYLTVFRGSPTCEEIQLQQFWRNPLFGKNRNETDCDNERTNLEFFALFTDENKQTP